MQLKRIFAILLAATLIFCAAAPAGAAAADASGIFEVGVVAETTAPVSVSPAVYQSGDEVSVKISAVQNTGITILKFSVKYDADALALIDWESTNLFGNQKESVYADANSIRYTVMLNNTSTATGEMLTLNFKVKDDFCGDVRIYAEVFEGQPKNCINGTDVVSFAGGNAVFGAHKVDVEAGVVTDPACTEEGYTTYHCALCDKDVIGNTTEALGHSPAEAVEENRVNSTCTEYGTYDCVVYCAVCNEELSREAIAIEPTGHFPAKAVEENRVDATCTEYGTYDSVVYCSVCDAELSREAIAIEPTGHFLAKAVEENRVDATCTEYGTYDSVVYCSVCDVELSREAMTIAPLGHDLITHAAHDPTCTQIGWDAYDTCSRCDYTTYETKLPLGHKPTVFAEENRVEATCITDGSYDFVVYCAACDEELSREARVIDAYGHNYTVVFTWSEYHKACTAVITCDGGCGLNTAVNCTVTDNEPNETQTVHVAVAEYDGVRFSDVVTCNKYLVTFKDWDGSVISAKRYHLGDAVAVPADPAKEADKTYTYAFAGWNKPVVDCAGNATYTATYTSTYIDYTVVFQDEDGSVISSKTYHYGDKVTAPKNPSKAADNTYTYAFAGWDKAVVKCAGDAAYTATYSATYIDYTVVFQDEDGSVISSNTYHYGDAVTVPADPAKEADNTYTYPFAGWDKAVVDCAGDATYTATYTPTYIEYTVEFVDWNGSVLSSAVYHWGDEVVVPPNPSRVADAVSSYSFIGWDQEITVCDGNKTYTALYKSWMFADVDPDSWQFSAASYVFANDLMTGKGKDENGHILFDPNNSITREEFVQVLYNAEGKPAVSIENEFLDVADNGWYKDAVLWAKENDIANGTPDGNFGVGKNITRQDMAMMLYKYAKLKGCSLTANAGEINQFADGDMVADYAKEAMDWAVTNGILSGKGNAGADISTFRLDPIGTATRAECAAMLKNFMTAFGL